MCTAKAFQNNNNELSHLVKSISNTVYTLHTYINIYILRWQLHNNTSSSTVGKDDISKIASCNRAVERVLADGLTHPTVMQFWISLEGIINDVMRLLSAPISETILEERPVRFLAKVL